MAFRLPRLPSNWKEQPQLFERYWDETLSQIEKTLNAILDIPLIEQAVIDAQTAADTAQSAADTAQTAAVTAQNNVDSQAAEASLVNSYTTITSGDVLTASASGDVTVAAHTRVYGDSVLNPNVSVTGGTVTTGAAPGSFVRIFYDDPGRTGGAVTYQFSVDPAAAPVQKGDRHVVGAISIPATGSSIGKNIKGPGYIDPDLL